jgi:hypothetical protein
MKQVGLGFPNFASKLMKEQRLVVRMNHHGGHVEVKQKTVGSMASGAA